MAHLNIYKKKQIRRTTAYQVVMSDLIELGIVSEEEYIKLTGNEYISLSGDIAAAEDGDDTVTDGDTDDIEYNLDEADIANIDDEGNTLDEDEDADE